MRTVEVAKQIRKELKKNFPRVKFSVRSDHGSINIHWTNFPTVKRVEEITSQYQRVRYDQATGEILSGGNLFVFCSNKGVSFLKRNKQKNYQNVLTEPKLVHIIDSEVMNRI